MTIHLTPVWGQRERTRIDYYRNGKPLGTEYSRETGPALIADAKRIAEALYGGAMRYRVEAS